MSDTEHIGGPHPKTWKTGATCDTCQAEVAATRAATWQGSPLMGIVPGGSKDTTDVQWHRNFGPGLDAYKKARDEGLQPDHSDLRGVAMAQKRVKSQEAALRQIKKYADIDGLKTTAGVDRDVT